MHFDEHEHSHDHHHDHHHEHTHDHHHHDHPHAGDASVREELIALMKYMVGHNDAHTRELAELAERVHGLGQHDAYDHILAAVKEFEKGNALLSDALKEI